MNALGCCLSGYRHRVQVFGNVSTVAFEGGGAKCRPDKAFGDVFAGGIEGAQIGIRLPLLEQQFDLPAQSVAAADVLGREGFGVEIGGEITRRRPTQVGMDDEAALPGSFGTFELSGSMPSETASHRVRAGRIGRCGPAR